MKLNYRFTPIGPKPVLLEGIICTFEPKNNKPVHTQICRFFPVHLRHGMQEKNLF